MPEQPEWFREQLSRLRGSSLYGDPVIRVVFGTEERDFRGHIKYVHPSGGPMKNWILERWQPAGFFGSRDEWEKDRRFYDNVIQQWVDTKGPFPERGAYTMVCPLWNTDGEFIELDNSVLVGIREKILRDEEFADSQALEREFLIAQKHQKQEQARDDDREYKQGFIRDYSLTNWEKTNRDARRGYSITPR